MMADFIATILIKAVTLSGVPVSSDVSGDFDQTMKAAEEGGGINVQV